MRLGEIKQKIDRVVSDSHIIVIKNLPLYGEQAQSVTNYGDLIDALETLSAFEWNDVTASELELLMNKYPKTATAILSLEDFNALSAYIGRINTKLPLYYSILDTMVEEQDEKIINIKLPEKIKSLDDLSEFNKRISTLFKSFQIEGGFEFRDFDKGTSWYEIWINGTAFYAYFIACLKVAQEYYKAEAEFFKSKKAEVDFEAAKASSGDDFTKETYKKNWLEAFIKTEVSRLVEEEIKALNGSTSQEMQTRLVIATTNLVHELGEGTEFHLSLNPPQYAEEQAGQLIIDYKKIREIKSLDEPKQGRIEAPSKK